MGERVPVVPMVWGQVEDGSGREGRKEAKEAKEGVRGDGRDGVATAGMS